MRSMVIAVLEMTLPRGNEADTIGALRTFWDTTCARPGCVGGVFQEVGSFQTALYIEMWQEPPSSRPTSAPEYHRLIAIMETAAERPAFRFNFVSETRSLEWVEQLRLGSSGRPGDGEEP